MTTASDPTAEEASTLLGLWKGWRCFLAFSSGVLQPRPTHRLPYHASPALLENRACRCNGGDGLPRTGSRRARCFVSSLGATPELWAWPRIPDFPFVVCAATMSRHILVVSRRVLAAALRYAGPSFPYCRARPGNPLRSGCHPPGCRVALRPLRGCAAVCSYLY